MPEKAYGPGSPMIITVPEVIYSQAKPLRFACVPRLLLESSFQIRNLSYTGWFVTVKDHNGLANHRKKVLVDQLKFIIAICTGGRAAIGFEF